MLRRSMGALVSRRVQALRQVESWPVSFAAAGVLAAGDVETVGDETRVVRLASVSKPVGALAVLVAAEEGVVDLDEPAGPPGSTARHLLAHSSGLPFEGTEPIAPPGRRRIYSNEGFRVLASHLETRADMPFADYVRAAVCEPLGLGLDPTGDPGSGMHASLEDVLTLAGEFLAPTILAGETLAEMTSVQFPGLMGVLPDHGRFDPLDWGLGVQLTRDRRPGWGRRRPSTRSATSAGRARSSGSIPSAPLRAPRSPTASSGAGRRRRGRLLGRGSRRAGGDALTA